MALKNQDCLLIAALSLLFGDLKMFSMLLGPQGKYTNYPCFLYEWDSKTRSRCYIKRPWTRRTGLQVGTKNVTKESFKNANKLLALS